MPISTSEKLFPVIPFNLLVDTDIGLIKFVNEKFNDPTVFYPGLLSSPDKPLINLLYNRSNINPLSVVAIDKENSKLDAYYTEFMEIHYVDIINRSITTNFFNAVKLWCNSEGAIIPTILCKSEFEKHVIEKLLHIHDNLDILISDYNDLEFKDYDPLYFKNYSDIPKLIPRLIGKNIYIAGYKYNFIESEGKSILPNSSILLTNSNIFKIIDVYTIDDSFVPKG